MDHPWRVKLRRANDHINALEDACDTYLSDASAGFAHDVDRQAGTLRVRLTTDFDPPASLSAILGDIVQNLRAALDALAWAACDLNEDEVEKHGNDVYFPITTGPEKWSRTVKRCLPNLDASKREVFRECQPWFWAERALLHRDPDQPGLSFAGSPLIEIHELARIDRHRGIHPIVVRPGLPWLGSPEGVTVEALPGDPWPIGPGDTVLIWRVVPPKAVAQVSPDGGILLSIDHPIGARRDSCVDQVRTLSRHVAQVVTQIEVRVLELVSADELAELRALHEIVQRTEEDLERLNSERDVIDRSFMDKYRGMTDAVVLARAQHERRSRELFD